LAPRRLGDLSHLVEKLFLPGEGVRPGGRRVEGNRLDLGFFLGLDFLLGKRGPVVVVVDALGEEGWHTGMAVRPGLLLPGRIQLPLHRAAVDAERAGERFHGGQ
jgi:hypothetical protein